MTPLSIMLSYSWRKLTDSNFNYSLLAMLWEE
jgi:hypothetical protein